MVKDRSNRQDVIRDIVRGKAIRTQRALVDELAAAGYCCTQATVSRDISEMGLKKKLPEGVYALAEDMRLQRMMAELAVGVVRVDNLVMVKTQPGSAPGICAAIDGAKLPHVVGTLAGDDTILMIAPDKSQGAALETYLDTLRSLR